ncbi:MAG TPA: YaiI/YqxD family protein [Acetivibrio clariflavus]|nr:YaiI/YqxD family protein [Acetivibrio clariflavus]HPU41316.1 YaiI/YqxD family protein [Acetivibrio clariflavus]
MKILVDADACPVKEIIVNIAKSKNVKVIMLIDTSHEIDDGYSEVVIVDKARDSVDFALINQAEKGDIVVTQDYGVATMALAKGAIAINYDGIIYSDKNMDRLLFERHLAQKVRRSGGRISGPSKRSKEQDEKFEKDFKLLLSVE